LAGRQRLRPPESLAIKGWTGEHVHVMTARGLATAMVPPLDTVLEDRAFRDFASDPELPSYVFAASFCLFLIDQYRMPSFVRLLRGICVEDDADLVRAEIKRILGHDLARLENDWHDALLQFGDG
jgi:hypothetical protein